jgi:enoyl-CoA hydratase/carnithine racemase
LVIVSCILVITAVFTLTLYPKAVKVNLTATFWSMKMPENAILVKVENHIVYITLVRPEIDIETAWTLKDVGESINGNNDIYVAVITGSGKVFCKGGKEAATVEEVVETIAAIDRPVIAAVNGEALGPGMEIALAADIRIASENAVFGLPQAGEGQIPSGGGTQRLPRIVGRGKALELLMTAENITASQALEIGLVSKVVPAAELAAEAQKLAVTVAAKGPVALRYLKEAITKGMDMTLEQGLRLEADLYFLLHTTSDRTEGIKSYLEKRTPKYEGK